MAPWGRKAHVRWAPSLARGGSVPGRRRRDRRRVVRTIPQGIFPPMDQPVVATEWAGPFAIYPEVRSRSGQWDAVNVSLRSIASEHVRGPGARRVDPTIEFSCDSQVAQVLT